MHVMPCHERLNSLGLYCREGEKDTALSIFGKLLRAWLLTFLTLLLVHFLNVEAGHASFPMSM